MKTILTFETNDDLEAIKDQLRLADYRGAISDFSEYLRSERKYKDEPADFDAIFKEWHRILEVNQVSDT